jgi:hypothetical protein
MPKTVIPVTGGLFEELRQQFAEVEILLLARQLPPGTLYELVAEVKGLRVEIRADEHPPPHFHVVYQGEDASFSITSGVRLRGNRGLERFERKIKEWWAANQTNLVDVWNRTRPTDCPVGPIKIRSTSKAVLD